MNSISSFGRRLMGRFASALAAGLVSLLPATAALAQDGPDFSNVSFTKTGEQVGCDFIEYRIQLYVDAWQADEDSPNLRLVFEDVLPNGLSWVSQTLETNLRNRGTGNVLSDVVIADDGRTLYSPTLVLPETSRDLFFNVVATARIDRSVLGHGSVVANQATMRVTDIHGAEIATFPTHAAGVPDDGDALTGDPFEITLDLADCDDTPPPPPPSGADGPCFVIEEGSIECGTVFGGTYVYKMPVGPDMAGRTIEVNVTTPGVWVDPPSQVVPAGGGVLEWTIHGAGPGMTVELVVTGVDHVAGPQEGLGICCTQTVEITIPEDLPCEDIPDGEPRIDVEKKANTGECQKIIGGWACAYTITVTNIGTGKHDGPMTIFEHVTNVNPVGINVTTPPWVCVAAGASQLRCDHPGLALEPDESTQIDVTLEIGDGFEPENRLVENCAWWAETDGDAEGPRSCDTASMCVPGDPECDDPQVPGGEPKEPKIEVQKSTDTPICQANGDGEAGTAQCVWTITVHNTGEGDHLGPITVFDELTTVPGNLEFQPAPPWDCSWDAGDLVSKCFHPNLSLPAGAQTFITVTATYDLASVVQNGVNQVRNCTGFSLGNDPRPETLDECDTADFPPPPPPPGGKADISIDKSCEPGIAGAGIACTITLTNNGDGVLAGTIMVSDIAREIGGGGGIVQVTSVTPDGPGWTCGAVPADTLFCSLPGTSLAPDTSRSFEATVMVQTGQRFENCAEATHATGANQTSTLGRACDEGGTDIVVEKSGATQAEPGGQMSFEITLSNEGTHDFNGDVRLVDTLLVGGGNTPAAIVSINPPFGCASEPTSLPINCVANMELAAGESRTHTVTVQMPDDPGEPDGMNCFAVLTPDAVSAPGGGASTGSSTGLPTGRGPVSCHPFQFSDLEERVGELCSGGMVLNDSNLCVCPEGSTWNGRRCAGGSTPPPPPPSKQCTLKPGQVRLADGRCVCPSGTDLRGGRCVEPPQNCTLKPGQVRVDGQCVCRTGWTPVENSTGRIIRCEPQRCVLKPGQVRVNGQCVCRSGYEPKYGQSRELIGCYPPSESCTPRGGQIKVGDKCVCPDSRPVWNGSRCVPQDVGCLSGWKQFANLRSIPKGWQRQVRRKGQAVAYCGRPGSDDKVNCPDGWQQFRNIVEIPTGWQRRVVREGQSVAYCGKARNVCSDAKRRKPDGSCCPVGTVWGSSANTQQSSAPRCVPVGGGGSGGGGGTTLGCPSGWKQFANPLEIPRGWQQQIRRRGKQVAFCGRDRGGNSGGGSNNGGGNTRCPIKGQVRDQKGNCLCPAGQSVQRGRCRPDIVECRRGQKLINGKCVTIPVNCKRTERLVRGVCVPILIKCKRGEIPVGNRCIRIPTKCKRGEKRINGTCVNVNQGGNSNRGNTNSNNNNNDKRLQLNNRQKQQLQKLLKNRQLQKLLKRQ